MIGARDDAPHPGPEEAVTFSFGDAVHGLYGTARAAGEDGSLGLLLAGSELVASASGAPAAAALRTEEEQALSAWRVRFTAAGAGFDLAFTALGAPLEFGPEDPAGAATGLRSYEQLCRVSGIAQAAGETYAVDCLGQRGRVSGSPDWGSIRLARTLSAWLAEDRGVTLAAVRTSAALAHAGEATSAWLVAPGEDGPRAALVDEARLSTTYDGAGRHRRAGLELWPEPESEFPRRVAGEVVCAASIPLGRLTLDTAFLVWRMEGAEGAGRYDIVRPAATRS